MRVAHFVHRYPPALGGAEGYFARLSRFLAAGWRVTVFTTNALDLDAFWSSRGRTLPPGRSVQDGVEVRRYALRRLPGQRYLLKALSLLLPHPAWRAWTLTCNPFCPGMWADAGRPHSFDVVHATAFPYAFPLLCARRLAATLGVPFFLTPFLHLGDPDDPDDRTRRAYLQPALLNIARSADRLFVQTEGERQALLAHGFAQDRIVLQGLGVDVADCTGGDRAAARAAWGAGPDEVVVGHLANNSREKGTVDLVEAAGRAWAGGARFRLVLAGPEMPNFRRWWQAARPAGPVRRLGVLDAQAKRDFFAGIDVFALPSRVDSFGLVLPEAWANGVPNVAYRAGGPAWVIRDGGDGLLVRCGDLDGLAGALARLAADRELRRRLGAAGRERIGREFRWEDKLRMVEKAYGQASAV
jgi:glycosyltransferase involved in cell wall biosynthesis